MKKCSKTAIKSLMVLAAMSASAVASAQTAGTWSFKVGINKITPKVDSGNMSAPALPNTKADVGSDTKPIFAGSYMATDNVAVELDLGVPYKHDLLGAGSVEGTGKIGSAEVLPPTLFVQYRFLEPKSMFRPYVGLGFTYAYFQKETGSGAMTALTNTGSSTPTTFSLDSAFGLSPQVGLLFAFNEKWFADVSVTKTYLKTTSHFSTGQTLDVKLNPVAVAVAVGMTF